ncbi:MAG: 4Fe-4S binding protein [Bacteroidota bacterium]|nr:4Fe-4S binding protein [Bacteroidota bacterium]MDP4190048.1 4Fe-4S binding protein [Bacteroidota bacterium]MDP4194952.1 4Fe-4S binding protein [Bacteroidota bacterium]
MKRKIVSIDEDLCDGCGVCVPNCAEGALQIIDGKARLISDLFCDGLGACLGHCPQGAITVEERQAEPYNERKVMDYIIKGGRNVIVAHLNHLMEHNEMGYFNEALDYLAEKNMAFTVDDLESSHTMQQQQCGCPGSREMAFEKQGLDEAKKGDNEKKEADIKRESELRQWPIQLHLINPTAQYYRNSDVLLAADCTAFAAGDFHKDFLKGKSVAIACPKLDSGKDIYLDKLVAMIKDAAIKSFTVLIMQVPCCRGLLQLAQQAINLSGKEIPLKVIVLGLEGDVLMEQMV